MKVSLNEIKRIGYGDVVAAPAAELIEKIGAQLGAVEDVEELSAVYQDVIVAEIKRVTKHPDADRLHICLVDDGGKDEAVERTEEGWVQVVCGAPNVREGLLVAWLPPGAIVPETYHTEAPFRLEARKLRGVVSHGMLASAKELALGDSHEGILEIDAEARPGQFFAQVYHLDDTVIDIENKMFTHRPDCFGLLGVARELAGIQHKQFTSPEWYTHGSSFEAGEGLELAADNESPEKVPRFMVVALDGVTIRPSPLWLQTALVRLGARPINNVVDITNYLMLLTGQPLHAYDYDKVGGVIKARLASEGEQLLLLNGKTISLTDSDIVIADNERPIGLGGVMGGGVTEVSDETTRLILEVATFDMYAIRRTSMRHGLFTDAVTRFNKGQSPLQNDRILAYAVKMLQVVAGATQASHILDHGSEHRDAPAVRVEMSFINERLGLELSARDAAELLSNVEFSVEVKGDGLVVHPPFWRTDIEIGEDVVEEVGRLYGYDRLPLELPQRPITPTQRNELVTLKQRIRRTLSEAGANELLTYSFVHEKLLSRAQQDPAAAYKLSNALSPDLQYYRLSVLPSLLDKVHGNIKRGHAEFVLFEIGKYHSVDAPLTDEGVPAEFTSLDMVYAAAKPRKEQGAAYYTMQRYVSYLMAALGAEVQYRAFSPGVAPVQEQPFLAARSALIYSGDTCLGIVGEFTSAVRKGFKLPETASGISIDMQTLQDVTHESPVHYRPLSKFPATERDVTLEVDEGVRYGDLEQVLRGAAVASPFEASWQPVSRYRAAEMTGRVRMTWRLTITNPLATITAGDANRLVEKISTEARAKYGAVTV